MNLLFLHLKEQKELVLENHQEGAFVRKSGIFMFANEWFGFLGRVDRWSKHKVAPTTVFSTR